MKKILYLAALMFPLAVLPIMAQDTVAVPFDGSCTDAEDGDLSSSLVWTSDVSGQIGTGATGSFDLPEGPHTITATCTDSGGKSASQSVGIVVDFNSPPAVTIQFPADGSNYEG